MYTPSVFLFVCSHERGKVSPFDTVTDAAERVRVSFAGTKIEVSPTTADARFENALGIVRAT